MLDLHHPQPSHIFGLNLLLICSNFEFRKLSTHRLCCPPPPGFLRDASAPTPGWKLTTQWFCIDLYTASHVRTCTRHLCHVYSCSCVRRVRSRAVWCTFCAQGDSACHAAVSEFPCRLGTKGSSKPCSTDHLWPSRMPQGSRKNFAPDVEFNHPGS